MAFTERYANFDLATGLNDGTSEANAWQTPSAVISNVAAGERVNIKKQSSPYDLTSTLTFTTNGTAGNPIHYRAYESTIGDGGVWEVAYNGSAADLDFAGNHTVVEGVDFQPGATVNQNVFRVDGRGSWANRCRVVSRNGLNLKNAVNSWFSIQGSTQSMGMGTANSQLTLINCFFKRVSTTTATWMINLDAFSTPTLFQNCIFVGNGNSGENGVLINRADSGQSVKFTDCRFYNFDSAIYVDEEPNTFNEQIIVQRSVFSTMAAYAVERTLTSGGFVKLLSNYYHSCTSGFTNYTDDAEYLPNTSLSASPYTTPGSDVFTINDTAGGGAVLRAAGFPINHPYDWDNFADQAVFEGGGGGLLTHPGMAGGMRG